ncbi:MAG: thioredoxin [Calditrichaeota bacterium]|nr:MAG: thioredoxin [Calditrichota bacterium]
MARNMSILLWKGILFLLMLGFLTACASGKKATKKLIEVEGEKMLVGELTYSEILEEFQEWRDADALATIPSGVVERLKKITTPVEIQCFLGTWCSDSKQGVPPMVKALQQAQNKNIHLTLYGVDRQKDDPLHLGPQHQIERVPTFIIYQNGEEIARLEEYPMNATFAEDLLDILNIK